MCTRVGGVVTRTGVLGQVCQIKGADIRDERYGENRVFRKYYNSDFTGKIVTDFSAQKLCFTWYTGE